MTKRDLIRKKVRTDVWSIMQRAWPVMRLHIMPDSDAQKKFLDMLSEWVYVEYGQHFTTKELEE